MTSHIPLGSKRIIIKCERCGQEHTVFTSVEPMEPTYAEIVEGRRIREIKLPEPSRIRIVGNKPTKCEVCDYPLKYPEFSRLT